MNVTLWNFQMLKTVRRLVLEPTAHITKQMRRSAYKHYFKIALQGPKGKLP